MRILLFAGKGGVGKTSMAGATGLRTAQLGLKTLVMSLDAAHSLADVFDQDRRLMDLNRGAPVEVADGLWIQELDIQEEIRNHWGEVYRYIATLFNSSGFDEVLAEELAIIPGMEEVSALFYINQYIREQTFDVMVLDCAPTGESIRFVSIPTALEWYIKKIFHIERTMMRLVRPVAKRLVDVPLPSEEYFKAMERLFERLRGVDRVLVDPCTTSVRLVTNPEKIVLKETQRAYMYFSLYRMCIDAVIVNRVLPAGVGDAYFEDWKRAQKKYLEETRKLFDPVPILQCDLFREEVVGPEHLARLARTVYGERNPAEFFFDGAPYRIEKEEGRYRLTLSVPFLHKEDVELNKVGNELIIRMGGVKRNILLPRQAAACTEITAGVNGRQLEIVLGGLDHGRNPD